MRGPQENPNFYRSAARLGLATLAIPGAMLVDRLVQASPDLQTPSTVSTGITVRLPNRGPSQTESSLAPYGLEVRRNSGTIFPQTSTEVAASASLDPQFEGGEVADNDETVFRSQNLMVAEAVAGETLTFTDRYGRQRQWSADNIFYSDSQGKPTGVILDSINGAEPVARFIKESLQDQDATGHSIAGFGIDQNTGRAYVLQFKDVFVGDLVKFRFDKGVVIADYHDNPGDPNGQSEVSMAGVDDITFDQHGITSFSVVAEGSTTELRLDTSSAVEPVEKRGKWKKLTSALGDAWARLVLSTATPTPTVVPPTATPTPKTIECGQAFLQDPPFGPLEASGAKQAAKNMGKGLPSGLTPQQEQALNVAPVGNPDNRLNNLDVAVIKNEGKRKKAAAKAKPPQAYSPLANVCAPVTRPARPGARPAGVEATATPSATRQAQIDNKRVSPTATPTRKAS